MAYRSIGTTMRLEVGSSSAKGRTDQYLRRQGLESDASVECDGAQAFGLDVVASLLAHPGQSAVGSGVSCIGGQTGETFSLGMVASLRTYPGQVAVGPVVSGVGGSVGEAFGRLVAEPSARCVAEPGEMVGIDGVCGCGCPESEGWAESSPGSSAVGVETVGQARNAGLGPHAAGSCDGFQVRRNTVDGRARLVYGADEPAIGISGDALLVCEVSRCRRT
ncbi:hypothetical protein G3I60_37200 [Streptomyces sp. SID13666]|uniref:hypothetical protein n=1 Tax=unclassified Streptomyces TaxID=2593676 RepID=UPI0013C1B964|nr:MULTISPECIES: hypothetical protein [unclassified Streptomyces]NEA59651.1 hypothetical protein [Streptomyces sp. SID13666]NEA75826.1 hypothetical protein [Streptomyces sp. SID13588]